MEELRSRIKKMAMEKSYMQLGFYMMEQLHTATGLDNLVQRLLQIIIENLGGIAIYLYYFIDDEIYLADVFSKKTIPIIEITDVLVNEAIKTRVRVKRELPGDDTLMFLHSKSWTGLEWGIPLVLGNELIGVLKIEGMVKEGEFAIEYVQPFLNYAALVLKIEIHGHKKITLAYNELKEKNRALEAEIIERKRVENELEEAKKAAEAASRAKSQFLSNMSHELRTPLNVILGNAQLMQRDPAISPKQKESLATINRSGEHLLELINDVLGLAKIEAGQTSLDNKDFNLFELLDNLESMFGNQARAKDLEFILDRSPEVPRYLYTDQRKLRQIIINLMSNAIKFTNSGQVTLCVTHHPDEDGKPSLYVSVSDTGQGIAPDEMEALFKAFMQTATGRQSHEGTGLGLSLCQRFVEQMGGKITASSTVGKGSKFSFNIIAPEGKTMVSASDECRVVGLEAGQTVPRILVVEDKKENRKVLVQLLKEIGIQSYEAVNGQEAVESWQKLKPDIIFMDMGMPVMNGYEATRHIRQLEAEGNKESGYALHVPVIAVTASAFEEERMKMMEAGCDGCISKPYRETEIFESISKYLDIHFTYQEVQDKTVENMKYTLKELSALPSGLVTDLRHAIEIGHGSGLMKLIEQVEEIDAKLAQSLLTMVSEYDYGRLSKIFEQQIDNYEK